MTKIEMAGVIDADNGIGFSSNVNLQGYTFFRNSTFVLFEMKIVDGVNICNIKYIHTTKDWHDFITVMATVCNFLMGNKVQFVYYKEKERQDTKKRLEFLQKLNFRVEVEPEPAWKYDFKCLRHPGTACKCSVYKFYK